jgi:F0F1-type ATP synthase assembly protein I
VPEPRQSKPPLVLAAEYSGLAMTIPAGAFVGWLIGYLLDRQFHTGKVFEVILLIAGVIGGMVQLIRGALRER